MYKTTIFYLINNKMWDNITNTDMTWKNNKMDHRWASYSHVTMINDMHMSLIGNKIWKKLFKTLLFNVWNE